jgi:asparagine synthase (glutamine-hydrolysing)
MCGIAGILGPSWDECTLLKTRDALAHRGPDDSGFEVIQTRNGLRLGLAHRRLSILDLSSAGHQPMTDPDTGNVIVFNGEIYNHLELRKQLPARQYRSTNDTETLLAAYAHWGWPFLCRLVGMFALALWDNRRQELFLARDRLGKKPLYYVRSPSAFAFASELKALLAGGLASRRANPLGIESFLAFGAVQEPHTILRDVELLAPGKWLRLNEEGCILEQRTYWSLHDAFYAPSSTSDARQIRSCFFESVKARLISDVPLGAFLSGGIDSTAVVAAMRATSKEQPRTFCLDFSEGPYREGSYAWIVARKFETEHHNVLVQANDLLSRLDRAFSAMDQPTTDGINTYFVSDVARRSGATVALSGQGGDEIFAGYPSFRLLPRLLSLAATPALVSRSGLKLFGAAARKSPRLQKLMDFFATPERDIYCAYAHQRGVFWDAIRSQLLLKSTGWKGSEWLRLAVPPWQLAADPINQVSQLEIACYLRNTLLRDLDNFSMAHSLEVRAPMLDHRLLELLAALPGEQKIKHGVNKPLLVSALGEGLPGEIVRRRKGIFSFPWEQWLRRELRANIEEFFTRNSGVCEAVGLNRKVVMDYWRRFLARDPRVFWLQIWALYVLARWTKANQVRL